MYCIYYIKLKQYQRLLYEEPLWYSIHIHSRWAILIYVLITDNLSYNVMVYIVVERNLCNNKIVYKYNTNTFMVVFARLYRYSSCIVNIEHWVKQTSIIL